MLQVVVDQPRQRRLFPTIPFCALRPAQPPQPSQVLPASTHFQQLKLESLMFDAAENTGPRVAHGYLLKTYRHTITYGRTKSKH